MSPNGEQYCLLHLLGDLSTVQNLSCPDVMKCNVLDSWIQSLSCENLVMTEVKKPSNRPLVLSNAAAALQYKDHQPTWSPHTFTHEAAAGEKGLRVTCTLCNYLSLTICIKWLHSAVGRGTLLCWRQIPALMSASFPSLFWLIARHVSSLWIMEWDGTELPGPGNLCQNFGWYRPIREADRPLVRK